MCAGGQVDRWTGGQVLTEMWVDRSCEGTKDKNSVRLQLLQVHYVGALCLS